MGILPMILDFYHGRDARATLKANFELALKRDAMQRERMDKRAERKP
jgi:hypothetical protein